MCFSCMRASKIEASMCACSSAAVQGGDLVRDPSRVAAVAISSPHFYFSGSGASERVFPQQLIVTWAAEGNNCSSYLTCFCASSAFVPFSEGKGGKNRYQLVGTCVCVCRAAACVLFVWSQAMCGGMGAWWGWILTRKAQLTQTHTHRQSVTHCQTSIYNVHQQWIQSLRMYVEGAACSVIINTWFCSSMKHFIVFQLIHNFNVLYRSKTFIQTQQVNGCK